MKRILLIAGLSSCVLFTHAQNKKNFWKPVDNASLRTDAFKTHFQPEKFISFQLDENGIKAELANVPSERKVSSSNSSFIISVPNPQGKMESFRVVEAPVMAPALAAKYPQIKSYAGKGIDEPASNIRFDVSPAGFHAVVISAARKTFYINPVDSKNNVYIVYNREIKDKKKSGFDCLLDVTLNSDVQGGVSAEKNANTGVLKIYRLAVAASGEYSIAALAGATGTDSAKKAMVLSVINTNLVAANAIFENEFNIRLQLIPNEDKIIYLDSLTDPWATSNSGWNTTTETTIDNQIGSANYDVGHLLNYTTYNNGNAGCIGCVCTAGSKGKGWTTYQVVQGSYLVIDYWAHELGHQFGGNHTFTHKQEGTIAQVEPGSGSTIMSYAGITGATDVQAHNDAYFHAVSIQQITDYIQTGNGKTCGTTLNLTNSMPVANAGADYTIPKSTPFNLTGTGTDADADVLTYNWEQMDAFGTTTNSNTYPSATSTKGPVFRSYTAVTSPSRTFPQLSSVLSGTNANTWEVLPSVARTLAFRLTVRDNHAGGSANVSDDMVVTVSSTTGPFAVTQPNSALTWGTGSQQTITWSVAGTNASPINCANVNILLSTDGGQTFPAVLAANTPNDGSQVVTLPSVLSSMCRIKVESVGNIFFDISNTDFVIDTATACNAPGGLTASSITTAGATLSWSAVSGASSYDVDYKATTSSTWINKATATTATSVSLTGLTSSTAYDWRVRTNCTSGSSAYVSAQFTTAAVVVACPGTYDQTSNNTFGTAVAIPLNTDVKGLIDVSTDVDYYKFTISRAGTITITLSTLPADYDIKLYNSSQSQKAVSQNSGTTTETINYTVSTGTYYVKVYPYNSAKSASCYTLKVATGTAGRQDTYASKGAPVSESSAKLFPNPAQTMLNVTLNKVTNHSTLRIFNAIGVQVLNTPVTKNSMQVNVEKLRPGTYFIKVEDAHGETSYSSTFIKQ